MVFSQRALLIYPAAGLSAAMQDAVANAYVTHLGLETFANERLMFTKAAPASTDYGLTTTHRQIASTMTPELAAALKAALSGMAGTWYLLDANSGALLDTNDATKAAHGLDWQPGATYAAGEVVSYQGQLYSVIPPGHTAQADWTPDVAAALFKRYIAPGEVTDWRQPQGAHDSYPVGARVAYAGKTWVNTLAANVWTPGVTGWTDEGAPQAQAWVPPTGAQDAYALGALVTHNGQTWRSLYAANVWEPGVFGWQIA